MTAAALGDRFGRRNLYAAGLALFTLASAGCALAPSVEWLIAARALQGAGSALLFASIGLALLSSAFPPEKRGAAIGIFSAITGLSVATGPLVGGAVVQGLSWEWIFWVNVPIGLAAVPPGKRNRIGESFGAVRDRARHPRLLVLVSGADFGVVWGLVRANDAGLGSIEIIAARSCSACCSPGHSSRGSYAHVGRCWDVLGGSRGFSAGNAAIFFTFASLFVGVFFLRAAPADEPRLQPARRGRPPAALDGDVPHRGSHRRCALADRIGERPLDGRRIAARRPWVFRLDRPDRRPRAGLLLAARAMPSSSPASACRWRSRRRRHRWTARSRPDEIGSAAGVN